MRVAINVTYDGTNYNGWQIQPDKNTIQGTLKDALSSLLKCPITVIGSGRTDAGVHAKGQVAHFDCEGSFPIERLPLAVNTLLPNDIRVNSASVASDDFHAQHSTKKKTYAYSFYLSKIGNPLIDRYSAQVPYQENLFDIEKAKTALRHLVGTHDFRAFCSSGSTVTDFVRTIYSATIEKENERFTLKVCGNGFLYNMVRIIAGTIVDIGLGRREVGAIENAIQSGERTLLSKTYPACGLTLYGVEY